MTNFNSNHQGVLDSLLNRLEGVTSRLEGLQVRGVNLQRSSMLTGSRLITVGQCSGTFNRSHSY